MGLRRLTPHEVFQQSMRNRLDAIAEEITQLEHERGALSWAMSLHAEINNNEIEHLNKKRKRKVRKP